MPAVLERIRPLVEDDQFVDWYCQKLESWERQRRINSEGFLRLSGRPVRKFYARRLCRLFPQLSKIDAQDITVCLYGQSKYRRRVREKLTAE